MTTFAELGLPAAALAAVDDLGYTAPTPVQAQAVPLVLEGRDVIAAAKTGTGKTAAFSLPTLARLPKGAKPKRPRMLVVTPTRELAAQIDEVCTAIGKRTGHRLGSVVGGVALTPQIQRLARGVDVLIATPGRLLDLMGQAAVNLSEVEVLVLDEADRMLDMGFLPSVTKIVAATPATRQTLLFSATVDQSIMSQVGSLLRDPALVQIAVKGETADTVDQYVAEVPHTLKPALLTALLRERGHKRVIVFARTRHRADAACRKLKRAGFVAEAIHSDRSQNQRRRALDNFASGATDILVATDVLARGIDVEDVAYVVNYDLPTQPEDYVHRIGRTGRAGARGFAVSFASPENAAELAAIEKFTKRKIPVIEVAGFDLEAAAAEAAARATRVAAKHDPELAQAARELAKKSRKKERARERAAEERAEAEAAGAGKAAKGKRKKAAGRPAAAPAKPAAKPERAPKARAAGKAHPAGKPAARKGARGASDLRPGRAHRAVVAEQRRKRR
ncbi:MULTISPECIES: DEAD/DEAH box helicase [unclassified Adlercreutzia]|uniref:DEAD/DEAH box helicase n=1 Tax=unclassified Adlercreutzia TaxID=2636013 RepID=UPI0013EB9646|nr:MULTISPECIES: DEAD/DEAH box helicase [unclassified Adlercreutzia]